MFINHIFNLLNGRLILEDKFSDKYLKHKDKRYKEIHQRMRKSKLHSTRRY
jgi:hypothetical protein